MEVTLVASHQWFLQKSTLPQRTCSATAATWFPIHSYVLKQSFQFSDIVLKKGNIPLHLLKLLMIACGTESLPNTTTVNRLHITFFAFLKKEEMRSGTHFTQQNVFLLTVVVTKHVWPYFQSHFPKTCFFPLFLWTTITQKATHLCRP